jgi:hypothetical protein
MPDRSIRLVHTTPLLPNSLPPPRRSLNSPLAPANGASVSPSLPPLNSELTLLVNKLQWLTSRRPVLLQTFGTMVDHLIAKTDPKAPSLQPGLPRLSPGPDLILTVDRVTQEYTKYVEYTPGTMVVPSCDVLNRTIGDVVPSVAELFHEAIWTAHREQRAVSLEYAIGAHARRAHVVVRDQLVALNISAVTATRQIMGGG